MGTILYRVETPEGKLGKPISLATVSVIVPRRLRQAEPGEIVRIAKVEYKLDPRTVPTLHTPAVAKIWTATITRFPDIGHVGIYVCKDPGYVSQHIHGNAIDWVAPRKLSGEAEQRYLQDVNRFLIQQGNSGGLPVSEVIFQRRKWTPSQGSFPYGGVPHTTHVHVSGSPLDMREECGP